MTMLSQTLTENLENNLLVILFILSINILFLIIIKISISSRDRKYNSLIDNLNYTGIQVIDKISKILKFDNNNLINLIISKKLPNFKKYRYNNSVLSNAFAVNLLSHALIFSKKNWEYLITFVIFSKTFIRITWVFLYISIYMFIFYNLKDYIYIPLVIILILLVTSIIFSVLEFDRHSSVLQRIIYEHLNYNSEEIKKIQKINIWIRWNDFISIIIESSFILMFTISAFKWCYKFILRN